MRHGVCAVLVFLLGVDALAGQPPPAEEAPATTAGDGDAILGAPSAFDLSGEQQDLIRVEADTRLHQEPAVRSPTLTRIEVAVELPVLERRGGWARVRHGSWQGWVLAAGEDGASAFDAGAAASPAWAPPSGPDPERLQEARRFLAAERLAALGPYALYTDVTDDELLAELSRLAARLPELFRQRFGLEAKPGADEAVVLYADEATYDEYARTQDDLAEIDSSGHALDGLATLSVGERQRGEVRSLLVHELAHLLSYQALGRQLPVWLSEGLAEDLAYCRSEAGQLQLGTLDGWRTASTETVRGRDGLLRFAMKTMRGGPRVSLELLRSQWREPERPPLDVVLELPHPEFMDTRQRRLHYAIAGFLVRYLLTRDDLAGPFRAFLAAVARGAEGDADDLIGHLGTDWRALESDFGKWLASNAPVHGPKKKKREGSS